jgi:hypothetical protein
MNLALEDETLTPSLNVTNQLPSDKAPHIRRMETSVCSSLYLFKYHIHIFPDCLDRVHSYGVTLVFVMQ